ncbi:hypothetical protein [Solitalea canadensis]|uniref:Uncharacterized protein n=1 Tax=Solitalea canadensis (strain ATCC 29591 / DSM 3403 / JCM 21819 / LMG 8368 / NBRC 15130 / NCIMB 12057 / USAM 9D) TaxID=929556 RepID=H8KRH3_SOLCM|nr:hypothetical protein [Solitalea canadensis]AFD07498.1 hypothetical protein Solca_2458 [Solitalea canadensis DSM 3403]
MNKLSYLLITGLILISFSCSNTGNRQTSQNAYFDLKSYFEQEAHRLNAENPKLSKTVNDNGKTETKTVRDTLWTKELSVFINSNINKPAWSKSYKVVKTDTSELYTAIDSALKTKSIAILRDTNGHIRNIKIVNRTSNELYDLDEWLTYDPNHFYKIERKQKAKLLKESHFEIEGRFL